VIVAGKWKARLRAGSRAGPGSRWISGVATSTVVWLWLRDRADSPRYPSLYITGRQPRPGDWATVLAEVARGLAMRHMRVTRVIVVEPTQR
jgi:hypothetical protein